MLFVHISSDVVTIDIVVAPVDSSPTSDAQQSGAKS